MSRKLGLWAVLGCALLVPVRFCAQEPPPYTLKVNAREVVLDVVVHDSKGHPVRGLKADDFVVVENQVPQTVRSVIENSPSCKGCDLPTTQAATPGTNVFRNVTLPASVQSNVVTVILIDALETPTVAQMYVRQQLASFFQKMAPGHLFAIFQLDTRLHLIQGFSDDPQTLLAAVQSKREMPSLPANLGKGDRQVMVDQAMYVMARYLDAFPGRKNVVWFTSAVPGKISGLKDNPFPDAVDFDLATGKPGNAQSLSRVAVYPIDGKGLTMYGGFGTTQADMDKVAERTGGQAYHNTNGLDRALTEITETSSDFYTLAYAPTDTHFNAHSRRVEITVKGRKLTVLYRHTYYGHKGHPKELRKRIVAPEAYLPAAPTAGPEGVALADRPAFDAAMELGAVPAGELLFEVSVKPDSQATRLQAGEPAPPANFLASDYVKKPFRNYELHYRVDLDRLAQVGPNDGIRKAELVYAVVVYSPEGEIVNSLVSQSSLNIGPGASAEKMVVGTTQKIAVPEKGIYFLRIGVQDLNGNLIGSMEVPMDAIVKPKM